MADFLPIFGHYFEFIGPRSSTKFKPKEHEKIIPRHITTQFIKTSDKEKIFKAARGKRHITYRGRKKMRTADFSSETM